MRGAQHNDHRKAEFLDLNEIRAFFVNQGFEVAEVTQWWRHVHGQLRRDGERLFFKVASTAQVGARTENEAAFYQQASPLFSSLNAPFSLPRIVKTGFWGERFYYLAAFIEGQPIATRYPPDTSGLASWLTKMAVVSVALESLDTKYLNLPRDASEADDPRERFMAKAAAWKAEAGQLPILDSLMEVADRLPKPVATGLGHGDFVPWHMLRSGESFVLVDAEHASSRTPLGYDVAYDSHRLATSVNALPLALDLIRQYRLRIPPQQQAVFDRQFRPLMALRAIGGLWDIRQDQTELKQHEEWAQLIVHNELF